MGYSTQSDKFTMNIELKNLTLVYDKHPVVHHLTATIEAGDLLAVVGPNGAGKSRPNRLSRSTYDVWMSDRKVLG